VQEEVANGGVVYVHCGSGVGRAPTMVAAYLISTGMAPEQAWACIQAVRPFIRPTPPQLEQIARFAAEH
jgi:protein-tyrosine phosphatase